MTQETGSGRMGERKESRKTELEEREGEKRGREGGKGREGQRKLGRRKGACV